MSVSQSGETEDLLIPFRAAAEKGLKRMNIVNKTESRLARECNCGAFLNCGRESSVASTKAFTCQVVVVALVSIWFGQSKNYMATKKIRNQLVEELKGLSSKTQAVVESAIIKT